MSDEPKIRRQDKGQLCPFPYSISPHPLSEILRKLLIREFIYRHNINRDEGQQLPVNHAVMFNAEPAHMEWPAVVLMVAFYKGGLSLSAYFTWRLSNVVIADELAKPDANSQLITIPPIQRTHGHRISRQYDVPRGTFGK